jgi:hypothetical protein
MRMSRKLAVVAGNTHPDAQAHPYQGVSRGKPQEPDIDGK